MPKVSLPQELSVPPGAVKDKKSCELLRAWIAQGGLHCSLNVSAWDDEHAAIGWGILLTDIARHVANALHESKNWNADDTINKIRAVFNAELNTPTADAKGKFV
ncbi:MAG TPA: DUF5076 domain-containing protein [Terriglobales bacterium]|nr:DUF5076 domain-containing protein [Terriglobales bacterium]